MRSLVLLIPVVLCFSACGYSFSGSTNPWAKKGITKVYIPMMLNNSLKAGVEVPLTSAVLKTFSRGTRVKVVSDEKDADAIVQGTVDSFVSTINSSGSVAQLSQDPGAQDLSDMVIAMEYIATATVTVTLRRKKDSAVLWNQQFSRPKIYQAGNRFGLQGDTSVLINASEEQIALQEISGYIAGDIYDTMLEAF